MISISKLSALLLLFGVGLTNECFENSLQDIFNGSHPPVESGIQIVFVYKEQEVIVQVDNCECEEGEETNGSGSGSGSESVGTGSTFTTKQATATGSLKVGDICHVCQTIAIVHKEELVETIIYSCPTSGIVPPLTYGSQSSNSEQNPVTVAPTIYSSASTIDLSDLGISSEDPGSSSATVSSSVTSIPSSITSVTDSSSTSEPSSSGSFSGYFNLSSSAELSSIASSSSLLSSSSSLESSSSSEISSSASSSSAESSSSSSTEITFLARLFAATPNGYDGDIFLPIATEAPSAFPEGEISFDPVNLEADLPLETNKFYNNFFIGDQSNNIWTYPYGLSYDDNDFKGLTIQHTNPDDRVAISDEYTNNPDSARYYYNPILTKELVLSAEEFQYVISMAVTEEGPMSATAVITGGYAVKRGAAPQLTIPMVQGMGFVTGIYTGGATPMISSLVGIARVAQTTLDDNVIKLTITLNSGTVYLVYVIGYTSDTVEFTVTDGSLVCNESANGVIFQVSVLPEDGDESYLDTAQGCYATGTSLFATTQGGATANYGWKYNTLGTNGKADGCDALIYLLPHHFNSISSDTASLATNLILSSTTKGNMIGFITNKVSLNEDLEYELQFLPTGFEYSEVQMENIVNAVNSEIQQDIKTIVTSFNSNYYAGKSLDKYAYLLLVVNDIIQDDDLAQTILATLKDTFQVFIDGDQTDYPLMYDTKFGGITSTATETGNAANDFGAAWYNDHHFHYGYFIHAAAVIGKVDAQFGGTWATDIASDWVNSLIRDVSNPSSSDTYFPIFRSFDWFHGHSWASGLYASADGLNEESSSEDYNYAYGIKLWGKVVGNLPLESMGDLMLQVMKKSMNLYFLFDDDNLVEPYNFIGNKVDGIIFDNKMDYSTYFGSANVHPEYVHGIHMLPITPASAIIRGTNFVTQEWNEQVSTFIDNVSDGWLGILRLNQALYDASSSYDFFSSSDFSTDYLDSGQSRSWGLAYSAGVANKGSTS